MPKEEEFSFKSLFSPLTTFKAIHIIIIVGLIVFLNSLFNQFIGDDIEQIIQNQFMHSLSNFLLFFKGSTFIAGGSLTGIYYKPIFSVVLSGIYSIFGASPFFFHSIQLMLHIANASLLYLLFSKFLKKYFALFLSLIFLIHPINSESVAYISGMQEPLFFFFGIVGLLFLLQENISIRSLLASQIFFLLSLFSKETGILFVVIAFLYIVIFKRIYIKHFIISSVLMISTYSVFRFLIGGVYFNRGVSFPIAQASLFERFISVPAILLYFVKTFFFPNILLFNQQWIIEKVDFASFTIPLLLDLLFLILFTSAVFVTIKNSPKLLKPLLFFSAWFFIGLILHLQIFPLDATVSDRWFYFPIVGLLGVIVVLMQDFFERIKYPQKQTLYILIAVCIIFLLSLRTIIRNTNWFDPITLYTHDIPLMKPNFALENGLAYEYLERKDWNRALVYAKKSVDLYPTFSNYTNLGAIYLNMGDIKTGEMYTLKALEKGNNFYLAYENLAAISALYDDPIEAKKNIVKYIERFPNDQRLYAVLAIAVYRNGEKEEAEKYALRGCEFSPDSNCIYILYQIEHNLPIGRL